MRCICSSLFFFICLIFFLTLESSFPMLSTFSRHFQCSSSEENFTARHKKKLSEREVRKFVSGNSKKFSICHTTFRLSILIDSLYTRHSPSLILTFQPEAGASAGGKSKGKFSVEILRHSSRRWGKHRILGREKWATKKKRRDDEFEKKKRKAEKSVEVCFFFFLSFFCTKHRALYFIRLARFALDNLDFFTRVHYLITELQTALFSCHATTRVFNFFFWCDTRSLFSRVWFRFFIRQIFHIS